MIAIFVERKKSILFNRQADFCILRLNKNIFFKCIKMLNKILIQQFLNHLDNKIILRSYQWTK